jgi:hypothetical protein
MPRYYRYVAPGLPIYAAYNHAKSTHHNAHLDFQTFFIRV